MLSVHFRNNIRRACHSRKKSICDICASYCVKAQNFKSAELKIFLGKRSYQHATSTPIRNGITGSCTPIFSSTVKKELCQLVYRLIWSNNFEREGKSKNKKGGKLLFKTSNLSICSCGEQLNSTLFVHENDLNFTSFLVFRVFFVLLLIFIYYIIINKTFLLHNIFKYFFLIPLVFFPANPTSHCWTVSVCMNWSRRRWTMPSVLDIDWRLETGYSSGNPPTPTLFYSICFKLS